MSRALQEITQQAKSILNLAYGSCAIQDSPNLVVINAFDDKSDMEVRIELKSDDGEDLFYLQDKRTHVGNDILWWAKNGEGYTTDLSKAETYTKEAALRHHQHRETDIPWPKHYVDTRTRPAVDMQYVDIEVALQDTGIELIT